MKKIFTILCAAVIAVSAVNAEVLLTEHFAQTTETLATNENGFGNEIAATGWTNINGSGQIYMNTTKDLTYTDYKSATDNTGSVEYKATFGKKAATPLKKSISSSSVYAAAIMDISSVSGTGRDYIFSLCPGTSSLATAASTHFARLYMRQGSTSGFRLAIAKGAEANTLFLGWTDDLAFGKYLVVVEYQFVDGDNNDVVALYLNPVKGDKPAPYATCLQDTIRESDSKNFGASQVADAEKISSVMLYSSANVKPAMLIDELKVTTAWADLWESGDAPVVETPTMVVEDAINFSEEDLYDNMYIFTVFPGKEYSIELEVLAENLTENITISHKNSELTLSTSTIDKAGGKFTVTLNPEAAGSHVDTIVYTSGELTDTTFVAWGVNLQSYSDLASLKAAYANDNEYGLYYFSGEAVVTRVYSGAAYLQDATAALRLSNEWEQDTDFASLAVGDKIGGFIGYAGETDGAGVKEFILGQDVTPLSQGNTVDAQVVTLAELQANGADYLLEIVTIEDAELDQTAEVFPAATKVSFTQNGKSASIQAINSSADYIGEAIPAKANITGFSINKSGTVIVTRAKSDIVSKDTPAAIDHLRVKGKAVKTVRDGQIVILRDGKAFNVLGSEL